MGSKKIFMRIKPGLLFTFFLLASFSSTSQVRSNKDLIGKWTASGLRLEFMADGRVMFTMRGGSIPGARYKSDFTRIPAVLHIELVQKTKKIVYRSTVEFINDDSFHLTKFDDDPAHVFDKKSSITLTRDH